MPQVIVEGIAQSGGGSATPPVELDMKENLYGKGQKVLTKEGKENYDRIFRKNKKDRK